MSDHGRGEHSSHDVGETPPDSDAATGELCGATTSVGLCRLPLNHDGPHEHDSDARGVSSNIVLGWETIRRVAKEGAVSWRGVALIAADDLFRCDFVPVPLPLAQRILAILELEVAPTPARLREAADELRAVIGK